jgi:hypothetical protein
MKESLSVGDGYRGDRTTMTVSSWIVKKKNNNKKQPKK